MKMRFVVVLGLILMSPSLWAQSWPSDYGTVDKTQLNLYVDCRDAKDNRLQLYSFGAYEPNRTSIVTVFSTSYSGVSDQDLKTFISDNGKVKIVIARDKSGKETSAELNIQGATHTFETCVPTDLGGGSVSVHN